MTAPNPPLGSARFDASPLTMPVDRGALNAYLSRARADGTAGGRPFTMLFVAGVAGAFVVIGGSVFGAALAQTIGGASLVVTPLLIVLLLAAVAGVVWAGLRAQRIHRFRLDAFARANGLSYLPELANPSLPGMIFDLGHSRASTDLVRGSVPRFVEFANYRYTTGSGKNSQTHEWGYIAIRLDVPLPNIVLDARENDSFLGSNLPARYDRHQRLSLEGDFDRAFSLYCPEGYERDALYLFTPDIMARFMDHAATFDAEIIDDWLLLYTRQKVSTLDPSVWAEVFGTVGAVLDKLAQWARWRDERLTSAAGAGAPGHQEGAAVPAPPAAFAVGFSAPTPPAAGQPWSPPPGVAAPGRRLRRSFPWIGVLVVVGVGFFWFVFPVLFGR
ncbi:hypothetical protein [uncultured Microbacterium sp.]|uniref:hypothetical protein n=1 Tax=uncultured Microbacterium sp. TaxID=191216 RepID=UPI0025E5702F|nr:hypothetical protein [uncultured Microbacterium sp.]